MLISIITPVYNDGKYLREMLENLKSVQNIEYEIIIINDGSTDPDTLNLLHSLDRKQYTLIEQEKLGISAARNNGIKRARGKYILPLDADNKIKPEYIYKSIEILDNNHHIDIVYSDKYYFGLENRIVRVKEFDISDIILINYVDACAVYRKKVWEICNGYDEKLLGYEDWEFWINAYVKGFHFHHIPEPLFYYRVKTEEESLKAWCLVPQNFEMLMGKIYAKHYFLMKEIMREKNAKIEELQLNYHLTTISDKSSSDINMNNAPQMDTHRYFYLKIPKAICSFRISRYFFNSAESVPRFFSDSILDKLKKIAAVILFYPKYLIKEPVLLKNTFHILFKKGPYTAMQYCYDLFKLEELKINIIPPNKPSNNETTASIYDAFVKNNILLRKQKASNQSKYKELNFAPLISVLVPVYQIDLDMLKSAVESIKNQSYEKWELCMAVSGDQDEVINYLKSEAKKDLRIKLYLQTQNFGISDNTNNAANLATGDFITFLDADDLLDEDALFEIARYVQNNQQIDIIYSDEDKINEDGTFFHSPFFKPDWSPNLLLSMNYFSHLTVMRRSLFEDIGKLRNLYDGAQDYDLILRATEKTNRIGHIPKILYHWRTAPKSIATDPQNKPHCFTNGIKALAEAINRRCWQADAKLLDNYLLKTNFEIKNAPLISIIIPTAIKSDFIKKCVESIKQKTTYKNYEIIIIDNNQTNSEIDQYLLNLEKQNNNVTIYKYFDKFNYAAINNFAVKKSNGNFLLFLNDDIEVINPDWLEEMLMHAQRKEIGAIGVKLYYPNKRIQHAGVIMGQQKFGPYHALWNKNDNENSNNLLNTVRECSAVTAACMMVRKDVFEEINCFDESFPVNYNDVDLCLKIRKNGYVILYTPYAQLYHLESATRGFDPEPDAKKRLYDKWGDFIKKPDPYYNPNFNEDPTKSFEWRGY